jgi:hypothetical protein
LEDKVKNSSNNSNEKNEEEEKRECPTQESATTAASLLGWFSVDDRDCTLKRRVVLVVTRKEMCSCIAFIRLGGASGHQWNRGSLWCLSI